MNGTKKKKPERLEGNAPKSSDDPEAHFLEEVWDFVAALVCRRGAKEAVVPERATPTRAAPR
jgi:hypothetical protein